MADFLLGNVFTNTQANPQPDALRQTVFALTLRTLSVLADASRLTCVFVGSLSFPYDVYGRAIQFSQTAFEAAQHSAVYPNAPAGLIFPKDSANPYSKSMTSQHWLTTSARLGLVWDPTGDGKQTIRVAASLMHDTDMIYYPERWTCSPPCGTQISQTSVKF